MEWPADVWVSEPQLLVGLLADACRCPTDVANFTLPWSRTAPTRSLGMASVRWPSHVCYAGGMARQITQRELRNESGEIMRELDRGESFVVTRNGVPVGELHPIRRQRFVAAPVAVAAFASAEPLDLERFRADVDRVLDQGAAPRG